MDNEIDIFNTQKVDDLPLVIRSGLCRKHPQLRGLSRKIVGLLNIKSPLTISEMQVGLYRKYGLALKRDGIYSTLSNLKARGCIDRVERGAYKINTAYLNSVYARDSYFEKAVSSN